MYACVLVQLRMECGCQEVVLPGGHDASVNGGKCLRPSIHLIYIWSTDERHGNLFTRFFISALGGASEGEGSSREEAAQLPSVAVSHHIYVHGTKAHR